MQKHENCKACRFWSDKGEKTVEIDGIRVRFRPCRCPQIDGLRKKQQTIETRVIAMSKANYPLLTHAKFACSLFEQKT